MNNQHDTIAKRLVCILQKFNSGEQFTVDDLIKEFEVSKRTIQRDLSERLNFLPIKKVNGMYALEEYCLGRLNYNDMRNFATLSSIRGLFPTLKDDFIVDVLNDKINQAYLVKGHTYEDLSSKSLEFKLINIAILKKYQLHFTYNQKPRVVSPYKLVNTNGIWYLVGDENDMLKTYTLTKLVNVSQTLDEFVPKKLFIDTIEKNEAVWFSQNSIEVLLEIDAKIAEYFLRRKLLPYQTLVEKRENGLLVSAKVSYDDEILKVIRYWMPHIKIVSPIYLQEKLKEELKVYLNNL